MIRLNIPGVLVFILAWMMSLGAGASFAQTPAPDTSQPVSPTPQVAPDIPAEPVELLTPPPPLSPRINGPRVYGCRPGHPFLFRIPTTGRRPITFTADQLPPGLTLDAQRA